MLKSIFPLIEDITMEIANKYGMIQPGESSTKAVRAVFVIDPKGIIRTIIYLFKEFKLCLTSETAALEISFKLERRPHIRRRSLVQDSRPRFAFPRIQGLRSWPCPVFATSNFSARRGKSFTINSAGGSALLFNASMIRFFSSSVSSVFIIKYS